MKIFEQEKKDGLTDVITANKKIVLSSKVKEMPAEMTKHFISASVFKKKEQPDLFYIDSIFVSAGFSEKTDIGWNLNDDVFGVKEVASAIESPIDKKLDYEHDESDIIGHMTNALIIDNTDDHNIIAAGQTLPDDAHIWTTAVLYKRWSDPSLQKRIDTIIAEIKENKWYVSMECYYGDFDYATVDKDGNRKIIARTEDTAFLTKHLRCFGGTGVYDGMKIGRYLKNIVFCGKGLVRNPGNPKSVIHNHANGSKVMEEVQALKDQIKALTAERDKLAEKQTVQASQELETLKANATSKDAEIAELKQELETTKQLVATAKSENEAMKAKNDELGGEIAKIKSQAKLNERIAQVKEAYAGIVDEKERNEKVSDFMTKFGGMKDDEVFANAVGLIPKESVKADEVTENKATGPATDGQGEGIEAKDTDIDKNLVASLSDYFGNKFNLKKKNKGDK